MSEFLTTLDGIIESTEEFIADDGLRADDDRIHDLAALLRVRGLYEDAFAVEDEDHEPTYETRLKDLNAARVLFDGRSLECYGTLLDGTTAWTMVHTGPLIVALVRHDGDLTIYGPFTSESTARTTMEQAHLDVNVVYQPLAPTVNRC